MPHFTDTVINQHGTPVPNVVAQVNISGTSTLATVYSDNLITQKSNPFTADGSGTVDFWAVTGTYDLLLSGGSPAIDPKLFTISLGVGTGTGISQSKTITTGLITAGTASDVVVTWDTPFPDATYKFSVEVVDATGGLRVHHVTAVSTTQLTVNIVNDDTSDHTGTLYALAF